LTWAVWAAWNYTAWITNWFDQNRLPVLLLILGLMFASLIMSVVVPEALDDHGLAFVFAYLTVRVRNRQRLRDASQVNGVGSIRQWKK
jgi:low temperature requirement protein LtrA